VDASSSSTVASAEEDPNEVHEPTAPRPTGVRCGVERWDVKTGADGVTLGPFVPAAITELRALRPPALLDWHTPRLEAEHTAYELRDVRLVCAKHERGKSGDGDFHLVVEERGDPVVEPSQDHGCGRLNPHGHDTSAYKTMIVEIPDPACLAADNPWRASIEKARATVESALHPEPRARRVNRIVTVRGVAFFDVLHEQLGVAPNGIELHPVLALCFGEGCVLF
jgi:hypothetical protein